MDSLVCERKQCSDFDSFVVEHIPKEIKKFIGDKKYCNKYL